MQSLYTSRSRELSDIPWEVYPRPQLMRDKWLCLNGQWELNYNGISTEILVPFCPESLLSGVKNPPASGTSLEYCRDFSVPADWTGLHILLHFGAVSRHAEVIVNGTTVAVSENSYLPFSADITDCLVNGNNKLTVKVINDLDHRYPWGKQKEKRGGMWYTPVSGIWQTVWLEPVPDKHISALHIATTSASADISFDGIETGSVSINDSEYPIFNGCAHIDFSEPHLWSPADPFLYHFTVHSGADTISSYLALRTLTIEKHKNVNRLCLNGKPFFFHALLDQGYWSDGIYTPSSPLNFSDDIHAAMDLGFNTLRKHIKIEPELFYYECDRLGMLVFQDMLNCGDYSFIRDTALPTIGIQRLNDRVLHRDKLTRTNFINTMKATVSLLGNHPCIVYWTIFNEGWGQFCADDAYAKLKTLDSSRFIDSTSGWFEQHDSDVESLHIYFKSLRSGKSDRPQVLSEFGGYVYKLSEHSFNPDGTYGYRICKDRESYVRDFRSLYLDKLLPLAKAGLSAAVYTQLSDVEDETNGLLSYDRAVCKLKPEETLDIATALMHAAD